MNEAELLFSQVLGCDRLALYLNKDQCLGRKELDFIACSLKRRIKGEPIQYILGEVEFMGLEFKVNQAVLIPRPETEIVVETALRHVRRFAGLPVCRLKVLDLGTGSGCIAISLRKNLTDLEIDASDISAQALDIAQENAHLNGAQINFIESDLFSALKHKEYDMIISNPPYIPKGQIKKLQPEVRFEPEIALNAGEDGLDFYRWIIVDAPDYLRSDGLLILEMGFGQRPAIEKIFLDSGKFKIEEIIKDYNSIDRVIVARLSLRASL